MTHFNDRERKTTDRSKQLNPGTGFWEWWKRTTYSFYFRIQKCKLPSLKNALKQSISTGCRLKSIVPFLQHSITPVLQYSNTPQRLGTSALPHSTWRPWRSLILIIVASILSGCISGNTPGTSFYILNSLKPSENLVSETGKNETLSIEIVSLQLPQYLQRPQIVTRIGNNRLKLAEFDQWAGNLQKNMGRVLAKNLSQLLATPNVSISPYHPQSPADYRVEVDVLQFEKGSDGMIHLSARWSLSSGKEKHRFTTRTSDLTSSKPLKKHKIENTVAEMSTLFSELSTIIAKAILNHLNGES